MNHFVCARVLKMLPSGVPWSEHRETLKPKLAFKPRHRRDFKLKITVTKKWTHRKDFRIEDSDLVTWHLTVPIDDM